MPILLTADDFGFDDDTVAATIECLESGSVTNASFMANMPATERAAAYAIANPQFCYGVHLTLTRDSVEAPVLGPDAVPGLVDDDGLFLTGRDAQLRALRGGSWINNPDNARADNRNRNHPDNRNDNRGFRLCSSVPIEPVR